MSSTADLFDANPDTAFVCDLQFRSFGRKKSFAGPCMTLMVNESHRPVLEIVSTPGEGRVLVVDGGGSLRIGLMGDRLAARAVENGWAGVVINGVIRDSVEIDKMNLGVKSLGTTARRSNEPRTGISGVTLQFGGVLFSAGDWVYADEDAVLVSAKPLALS